jgi:hypothetical protein
VLKVAKGQLFLVEAKRSDDEGRRLASFLPEAVGQALALARISGCVYFIPRSVPSFHDFFRRKQTRFCLSNGTAWIFAIVVDDDEITYYESTARRLESSIIKEASESALDRIKQLIVLIQEWVCVQNTAGVPQAHMLLQNSSTLPMSPLMVDCTT